LSWKPSQEIMLNREAATLQSNLATGLVVSHKTFGKGVIVSEVGNVINVRFKDGSQRSFMKDICEQQKLIWAD